MFDRTDSSTLSRLEPHVAAILRALYQVGEASNVGPLKGVAGVGSLVLEKCMLATRNQDQARHLSERILDLLQAIQTHAYDSQELTPPEEEFLVRLMETLQEIEADVKVCLGKRSFFARVAGRADADVRILQKQESRMRDALAKYQAMIHIDIRKALVSHKTQLKVSHGQIKDYFHAMAAEVASSIKQNKIKGNQESIDALFEIHRPSPIFLGRDHELETIVTSLKNDVAANLAILGAGGIGKTTLAKQVLHHPVTGQLYKVRRYFVFCEAATDSDTFLNLLGGQLGLTGRDLLKQILNFLQNPNPTLLVLDNFESPWDSPEKSQVEEHLAALSNLEGVALIVTLRGSERPSKVKWSRPFLPALDPLDRSSARRLFFAEADCDQADPAVDGLLARVDYIPLAITLLSSMAQVEDPTRLLERYDKENTAMLTRNDDRGSSVDVSISLSLNCHRMNRIPEARDLLSALALLPDGLSERLFGLIFKCQPRSNAALTVLKQTALTYVSGKGDNATIRVLAPIRQYMLDHHRPPPMLLYSLEMYIIARAEISSKIGGTDGGAIAQDLLPEIRNMHAVLIATLRDYIACMGVWRDGQPIEQTIQAAIQLTRVYRFTSRGSKETCELAIEAAKKAKAERLHAEAIYVLAQLYHRCFNEYAKAEELVLSVIALYSQQDDIHNMAEAYHLRGVLASMSSRPTSEVISLYELGLQFSKKSRNKRCEAKCLSNLSEVNANLGLNDEATRLSEQALEIFNELGDLTNMGFTSFWLGRIAEQRSRYSVAKRHYRKSTDYFRGSGSLRDVVRPLNQLGDIAYIQCDFAYAIVQFNDAMEILEQLGEENKGLASYVLVSRALVHSAMYELDKASSDVQRAMVNFQNSKDKYGQVQCLVCIGDISYRRKENKNAEASYRDAIFMAEERKQYKELGLAKQQLSKLLLHDGKLEEAVQVCSSAFQTFVLLSDVYGKATSLLALGDIFLVMGNVASAESSYAAALHFLRSLHAVRGIAECLLGLGKVAKVKKMEKEGRWFLREAEGIFAKLGDRDGKAECLGVLEELNSEPAELPTLNSVVRATSEELEVSDIVERRESARMLVPA